VILPLVQRMAVTTYQQWLRDGSPWSPAACISDFARTIRGHGFTVYTLGAVSTHLDISFPEDHAPFSHTPWPGAQPYPKVLALDIMPGGSMDWRQLGMRIHNDRNNNVAGTQWIKYMNYTDTAGACFHASWQPGYARRGSSDTGHIHISARTDYVGTGTAYDPVTGGGVTPTPTPAVVIPAWPGTVLANYTSGHGTGTWQQKMRDRKWPITVDDQYGPVSEGICRQFQQEKGLAVDGKVGPLTWHATWSAPQT
jgi:hypothetical protein